MIMSSLLVKSGLSLVAGFAMSSCGVQDDYASGGYGKDPQPAEPSPALIAKTVTYKKDKHGMASYKDSDRKRYVRTTSFSHMEKEPGAPGRKNAAGTILKYGKNVRSAAADWSVYPLGTKFKIKGQPYTYVVDDYGSALANTNTIDIFKPTLKGMRDWGTRNVEITVVQWGCYERSRRLLKGRRGYWHCRDMYNKIVKKVRSGNYAKLENDNMDAL
ncbi:hypothetical protein Rhal01_02831 [Rubritalea halochordaticola]|uniref:3D domain-containing protein n=2 Tax=Rubritalea halochordaticola TaxID=714537 RepID=A0ABP9V1T3_9BACT